MLWVLASLACIALVAGFVRFRRNWVRPWHEIEQLVKEVANVRTPPTFLVDGNPRAQRIGLALEEVFLRQRELASRAQAGELNVRGILDAMQDGLAVIDGNARVRLLNPALRRMFSISVERDGAAVLETFRDSLVAKTIDETLRTGAPLSESLKLRVGSADAARQLVITSLPMQNDRGASGGAIVLFQDVTHLQQLEQVRREFVSNVSHELRTPLSIFRGYLETLIEEPELAADERQRILGVLQKHSARLHSLVDDLLSLARLEAPDPQLTLSFIPVPEFLAQIAKEWEKPAAAKELRISVDAAGDLPMINADEARLEEIIYNLLDNALNYSRAGGQITIGAAPAGANHVAISVRDEGAGIAAADLPRIFERFYRADKARSREVGGTGLGLSIVKHIVQLHRGTVTAESQLGRGTIIHVTLPINHTGESLAPRTGSQETGSAAD